MDTFLRYHQKSWALLECVKGDPNQKHWSLVERFRAFGWARWRCCSDQPVTDLVGVSKTLWCPRRKVVIEIHNLRDVTVSNTSQIQILWDKNWYVSPYHISSKWNDTQITLYYHKLLYFEPSKFWLALIYELIDFWYVQQEVALIMSLKK